MGMLSLYIPSMVIFPRRVSVQRQGCAGEQHTVRCPTVCVDEREALVNLVHHANGAVSLVRGKMALSIDVARAHELQGLLDALKELHDFLINSESLIKDLRAKQWSQLLLQTKKKWQARTLTSTLTQANPVFENVSSCGKHSESRN